MNQLKKSLQNFLDEKQKLSYFIDDGSQNKKAEGT